jgi:hypothetical protein
MQQQCALAYARLAHQRDLRGIHSIGNGIAWASGTNGTVLRTADDGDHWQLCTNPKSRPSEAFTGLSRLIQGGRRKHCHIVTLPAAKSNRSKSFATSTINRRRLPHIERSYSRILAHAARLPTFKAMQFAPTNRASRSVYALSGSFTGSGDPILGKFARIQRLMTMEKAGRTMNAHGKRPPKSERFCLRPVIHPVDNSWFDAVRHRGF